MTVSSHLRDHCLGRERIDAPVSAESRYGWMFDLPALEVDEALLHRAGNGDIRDHPSPHRRRRPGVGTALARGRSLECGAHAGEVRRR